MTKPLFAYKVWNEHPRFQKILATKKVFDLDSNEEMIRSFAMCLLYHENPLFLPLNSSDLTLLSLVFAMLLLRSFCQKKCIFCYSRIFVTLFDQL